MKNLSFSKLDSAFVSEPFKGGVAFQVANSTGKTVRVGIQSCINEDMGWCNQKSVMVDATAIVFIKEYAKDQLFRLTSLSPVQVVTSELSSAESSSVSSAAIAEMKSRIDDLEDGQEPLVLSVNEDGDLTQTGVSSGTFGVSENGDLTFTEKE